MISSVSAGRRCVRVLILVASIGATLQAPAFAQGFGAAGPALRWGGDAEGGAPYVEADPADPQSVKGFDVEIAALIAEALGRKPEFVQVAFARSSWRRIRQWKAMELPCTCRTS